MKVVVALALAVAGLVGLSTWVTGEGVFTLLFGWIGFLARVLPKVQVNRESAAVGAIALVLFTAGVHWLGRGAARATRTDGKPRRPWRFRWTAALVALVIVAFAAGTATIGIVHQLSWLAKSEQPLLGEAINPPQGPPTRTLKMLWMGLAGHESAKERLPASAMVNEAGQPTHGWEVTILPFSGAPAYAPGIDWQKPWNDSANQKLFKGVFPLFVNADLRTAPLVDEEGYGLNHYSGNSRVLTPGKGMAMSEIKDGTGGTILIGEGERWFQPLGPAGERARSGARRGARRRRLRRPAPARRDGVRHGRWCRADDRG